MRARFIAVSLHDERRIPNQPSFATYDEAAAHCRTLRSTRGIQCMVSGSLEPENASYDVMGRIDEGTLSGFQSWLAPRRMPSEKLSVNIDSLGGNLGIAVEMRKLIRDHRRGFNSHWTSRIHNECASSAVILALEADQVVAVGSPSLMVHQARIINDDGTGRHNHIKEKADLYMARLLSEKGNFDFVTAQFLMSKDRYMSRDEAIKWGLVDRWEHGTTENRPRNTMERAAHKASKPYERSIALNACMYSQNPRWQNSNCYCITKMLKGSPNLFDSTVVGPFSSHGEALQANTWNGEILIRQPNGIAWTPLEFAEQLERMS